MCKKTVKDFLDDFNENPKEIVERINKSIEKQKEEVQISFDDFLNKVILILENTDKEFEEIKVEENGLFISDNIEKVLKEVNQKWWDILNMPDFELIKNCKPKEKGFLYTQLVNLSLELWIQN